MADVLAARERIAPYLTPTPLRNYPALDEVIGHDVRIYVKHENHNPTNSFKVRNALSALTALGPSQRRTGIVGATRGNHGLGLAYAGARLGVPVTICVPVGNNPDKNRAMADLGAELIERGRDYDESVAVAQHVVDTRGLHMVHSTNDATVIAGAATLSLEILQQAEQVDAIVVAVGGGSQAVGALTIARHLRPDIQVFGVQAANAAAIHDGWQARAPVARDTADTFADGLATRHCYEMTFGPLCEGLTEFTTVSEAELADAVRVVLRTTHNLAEGAGVAGVAGARKLASRVAGKSVAVILSGSNIDELTLRRIINREL